MYAIDDQLIDRARAADDYLQPLLAAVHRRSARRPRCLCSASETGGVEMYVARIGGRYVLKRMPGTGPQHAPACTSYTPPTELSGAAPLLGTAIREQPNTGITRLTLGFPLTHRPGRVSAATGEVTSEADGDESKLTLRSLLHFLWEEAEFVRWVPAMSGRRHWPAIRRYILQAAQEKTTRTRTLSELLWLPEPFTVADKTDIAARRTAMFAPYATAGRNQRLLLGLGEVKDLAAARFGRHKLTIKHAPDCPLLLDPNIFDALQRTYGTELALWQAVPETKLIALATFGITSAGVAVADRVAVMNVTKEWIPFDSVFEHTLITGLVEHGRRFRKTLRYNQPATTPLASLVLTDTDLPTACYLTTTATSAAPSPTDPNAPMRQWIWNTTVEAMPAIPPKLIGSNWPTRLGAKPSAPHNAQEAPDPTRKEAPSWPINTANPSGDSTSPHCATTSATTT